MSPSRAVVFAVCAFATLVAIFRVLSLSGAGAPPWLGVRGIFAGASSQPFTELVLNIDPGGPGDRAGLRTGDLIDLRSLSMLERFGLVGQPLAYRPIEFTVRRGAQLHRVTMIPLPGEFRKNWYYWVGIFASIWLILFALLLMQRGGAAPEMRLLTLALASSTLWLNTDLRFVAAPWAALYIVAGVVRAVTGALAIALWAAYASRFAQPLSPLRRTLKWLCYAFALISALVGIAYPLGTATLWFDPIGFALAPAWVVPSLVQVVLALACGICAIVASRGIERQRAAWSISSLAVLFCAQPLALIGVDQATSYNKGLAFLGVESFAMLIAPIGLTYATLSRRLFDIGFVLNRVAVYGVLTASIIAIFVAVEFLLGSLLINASRTTSLVAQLVVALALGISIRYFHRYVDRFVDRVLFAKRHADESALRRFGREAEAYTSADALLNHTLEAVSNHTEARGVAIYLAHDGSAQAVRTSGPEFPAVVALDDPLLVKLRRWNEPVDTRDAKTAFPDGMLFPMTARGKLVGALACESKRDSSAFAPDERESLLEVAHGVGAALDVLSVKGDGSNGAVLKAIGALSGTTQSLSVAITALPDTIAERIRAAADVQKVKGSTE